MNPCDSENTGTTHWNGCGNTNRPEHRNCPVASLAPPSGRGVPNPAVILTDLIEELRGLTGDGATLRLVDDVADRAEARLRGGDRR